MGFVEITEEWESFYFIVKTMTYVKPSIEEKADFIILHTGKNDLRWNDGPEEISNNIVHEVVSCKEGRFKAVVSVILSRRDKLNEKRTVVNEKMKKLCIEKNIYFLEHWNFNPKYHLNGSKLHPNKGSGILAFNFLHYFDNT